MTHGFKPFPLPPNEWTLQMLTVSALKRLLVEAADAGGGTVNVPEGIVIVDAGAVQFPATECNIWLRGAGQGKTILKAGPNITGNIIQAKMGCSNVMMSDFTVDGSSVAGNHLGVNFGAGFVNGLVERVTAHHCGGNGFNVRQASQVTISNCESHSHINGHCYAMGGDEFGGPSERSTDLALIGCIGYNIGNTGKYGIDSHAAGFMVSNCHIYDCYRCAKFPDAKNGIIQYNIFALRQGGLFHLRASDDAGMGGDFILRNNMFINEPASGRYVVEANDPGIVITYQNNTYPETRPAILVKAGGEAIVTKGSMEDMSKEELFTNPETVTAVTVGKPERMKYGFHYGPDGHKLPLQWFYILDEAGIPFCLKITDSAPDIQVCEIARNSDVPHSIIFRRSVGKHGGVGVYDVPSYNLSPMDASAEHFSLHYDELPPEVIEYKDVVMIEDINEVDKERSEWLAEFSMYQTLKWNNAGFKYLCFGWSGGEPEPEHWQGPKMLDLLRMCNGISLHEYSFSKDIWNGTAPDGSRWLMGRFEHLHAACDANGIARPEIHITEAMWGRDKGTLPDQPQRMIDYYEVGKMYAKHPNIKSVAIWCFNGGEWGDIGAELYKDYPQLLNMMLDTEYPPVEETPPMTETLHEHLQRVAKENQTVSYNRDAALQLAGNRDGYGITGSEKWTEHEGIKYAVQPFGSLTSDAERYYYSVVGDWGNVKYGDLRGDETSPSWTILNIPHMSQRGPGAEARYNDCGAAAVSMVINGQTNNSPTVNDISAVYQDPPNSYMNFNQLDLALNGYGMNGIHKRPYFSDAISDTVRSGKAVIALVWYQSLPYQFDPFNGSHFIVIYGSNGESLLYRDSLAHDDRALEISFNQLDLAMVDVTQQGNQPSQAMDCEVKTGQPPTGQTYKTADFMIPDPRSWVVVQRSDGSGEDIYTIMRGSVEERIKNGQEKEVYVWRDGRPFRRLDTSMAPVNDTTNPEHGIERLYKQFVNGVQGGQIAPAVCEVGKTYTFYSDVRVYAKSDCRELSTHAGNNVPSTFKLVARYEDYTFANGFHVDVFWETIQTGEYQFYCEKDGIKMGWCGGGAKQDNNEWSAMPKEFYIDRQIPTTPPPDYC